MAFRPYAHLNQRICCKQVQNFFTSGRSLFFVVFLQNILISQETNRSEQSIGAILIRDNALHDQSNQEKAT